MAPGTVRWLVDGNNVMGSRPDGWWRDRKAAARRLVSELAAHSWPDGARVTVVFDARAPAETAAGPEGKVEVVYAGPARSADDRLVDEVAATGPPVTVVTSDRELAQRVRALGADVVPAGRFLAQLHPGS